MAYQAGDSDRINTSSFAKSKEMVFEWCKSGQHDKCRTQYGGDRIICSCTCDPESHGKNYEPISKKMTENELNTSIASINQIMSGDAGDGVSKNRAVRDDSTIWGEQVRRDGMTGDFYKTTQKVTQTDLKTGEVKSYNYVYEEKFDAKNITELEERRARTPDKYTYEGFEAWI